MVWYGLTLGALVLVEHHHADGGAEGDAKLGARLDQDAVLFVAGGRDVALAGATARHLGLDVVLGELHAGGDAVDDAADGAAVRLAIAANSRLESGGDGGGGGRTCGRESTRQRSTCWQFRVVAVGNTEKVVMVSQRDADEGDNGRRDGPADVVNFLEQRRAIGQFKRQTTPRPPSSASRSQIPAGSRTVHGPGPRGAGRLQRVQLHSAFPHWSRPFPRACVPCSDFHRHQRPNSMRKDKLR